MPRREPAAARAPAAGLSVATTCPYCGVGCGVLALPSGPATATVTGDPAHPANGGRLCSKGSALGETLSLESRLLHPKIGGRRVAWDEALAEVASHFRATIARHGPDAVALYVSGQMLTEDYYVANKLMKGYIGSANIDTNSRLCMASTVAGQRRAFGEDIVPGCYEDLELADLVVLVGSNAAWCHPVIYQRLQHARERRPDLRIVTIDPRRTATAANSDLHLAIRPGSDVLLFNGLLEYLRRQGRLDLAYIDDHLSGCDETLRSARASAPDLATVAAGCGIGEADLSTFYHWFAATEKTVTAWSQGVNQSSSGTDKVTAILNVHLATGRIGRPGMGPFSLTGQPNAMGGREVGGLANQLAAHLDIENPRHRDLVRRFWNAPRMADQPGLKAVDLFKAIGEGKIKAVWIMATNPAVSLPDLNQVRAALVACEFVAVSDNEAATDLSPYAHVSLPALAWGEKNGTVTNSERRISRQQPFLPAPGEARPDWWIVTQVAQRMGFADGFRYRSPRDIFIEHARLSGFENDGERLFDISALAVLSEAGYDALQPLQWPVNAAHPQGCSRLFGAGGFPAAGNRARLLPIEPRLPHPAPDPHYPLVLNTGRVRDQWHTMTRTGKTARLCLHRPEPCAELHPDDAARHGILDGELVQLESAYGKAMARAQVSADQRPGSVFMPMHWSGTNTAHGLVNNLVNPVTDPISGEPESKHTPVRVSPFRPAWQAFLLSREDLDPQGFDYAVRIRGGAYWRYELAGAALPADWGSRARELLGMAGNDDHWLEFAAPHAGRYRCALLRDGRLHACLFVAASHELPPRDWLSELFSEDPLAEPARRALLSGTALAAGSGRTVCFCFGVGIKTLERAIRQQGLQTVEQIGAALRAGTQCGSCVPELKELLKAGR
ncbi:MAG: nitrate reductase [Methylococcaceae bacterium]|nr:nitrate reductase [Methylococcaceae bacterium]